MRSALCLTALEIHYLVYNWMDASHPQKSVWLWIHPWGDMDGSAIANEGEMNKLSGKKKKLHQFILFSSKYSLLVAFLKIQKYSSCYISAWGSSIHKYYEVVCLHLLLQLNSIATNKPWNACFAFKPVLQISSYIHSFILWARLPDEYFVPDVNVTVQWPFLMCISAEKQGPSQPLYFRGCTTLQTPGTTNFHQRDLHGENEKWHPLFPLLVR